MLKPTWCPGCGNFGIWQALKDSFIKLSLRGEEVALVYGIGCHGNMANWSPATAFEGLHGRALPLAQGIKMANPNLTVVAVAGDGDCYGEGGNHLLHAARHNIDITLLVHNNQIYALTAGQASPSSSRGLKTKSTPSGAKDIALNPILVSIAAGAGFVARGFAGDILHLTDLIAQAICHKGFSIVDVLQPCVTFNQGNTLEWFKERIYELDKKDFKPDDKLEALKKALEWPAYPDGKIPIGIFYQEEREVSEGALPAGRQGILRAKQNLEALIKEFL